MAQALGVDLVAVKLCAYTIGAGFAGAGVGVVGVGAAAGAVLAAGGSGVAGVAATGIVWAAVGAGDQLASPAWEASRTQRPGPVKRTSPEERVQPVDEPSRTRVTGSPEPELVDGS